MHDTGFSLSPDRPEGGIVGISDIAQGCIKGLGIRQVELGTQSKPAGEIGVSDKRPPKCDSICLSARKNVLRRLLGKAVIRDENTLEQLTQARSRPNASVDGFTDTEKGCEILAKAHP